MNVRLVKIVAANKRGPRHHQWVPSTTASLPASHCPALLTKPTTLYDYISTGCYSMLSVESQPSSSEVIRAQTRLTTLKLVPHPPATNIYYSSSTSLLLTFILEWPIANISADLLLLSSTYSPCLGPPRTTKAPSRIMKPWSRPPCLALKMPAAR